jgi:hypothetical protein
MKILNERPPEWIMKGCLDQFRVNVDKTFWTYGDTIYNPGGIDIPDHIIAHEEQHGRQQEAYVQPLNGLVGALHMACERHSNEWWSHPLADGSKCDGRVGNSPYGKDAWWREYLSNPRFRLEQEAEAYGEQYKFFCDHRKDRNQRSKFCMELASQLSGPLYQLAVSHSQARALILVLSGHKKLEQVA